MPSASRVLARSRRLPFEVGVGQLVSVGHDKRLVPELRCAPPHQRGDRRGNGRERHERRIVAFPKFENTGSRSGWLVVRCRHAEFGRLTVAARLDRIESTQAIGQLPSRYAMALDARDLDALVALFVDDVEAGAEGRGREALKHWFDGVLRRFYRSIHLICGHQFEFVDRRSCDWFDLLSGRARGWRRVVRDHDAIRRHL